MAGVPTARASYILFAESKHGGMRRLTASGPTALSVGGRPKQFGTAALLLMCTLLSSFIALPITSVHANKEPRMTRKLWYATHPIFALKVANRIFLTEQLGEASDVLQFGRSCTDPEMGFDLARLENVPSVDAGMNVWAFPCIPLRLLDFDENLLNGKIEFSLPDTKASYRVVDGLRTVAAMGGLGRYAITDQKAKNIARVLLSLHGFNDVAEDRLASRLFCFPGIDTPNAPFNSLKFLKLEGAKLKSGTRRGEVIVNIEFEQEFLK